MTHTSRSRAAGPLWVGLCLGLMGLAGCGGPPDFEGRISPAARAAPYPALVPTDPIVAAHGGPVDAAPLTTSLEARVSGLERKAGQIQDGPIIDAATLRRLEAARQAAAAQ